MADASMGGALPWFMSGGGLAAHRLGVAEFLEDVQGLLPGCVRGVRFAEVAVQVACGAEGLCLAVTVTAGALADGQGTPEAVR
jgi:hypothetical protein